MTDRMCAGQFKILHSILDVRLNMLIGVGRGSTSYRRGLRGGEIEVRPGTYKDLAG